MWLTRTSRKKKIDSSRICSSVYIISIITEKKRLVYMHILLYGSVLSGPQEKDLDLDLGYYFSQHKGNERACALHPKE